MTELITNGDFADGDTGWTLTGSASTGSNFSSVVAGMTSPSLIFSVTEGSAKQDSVFTSGTSYTVSLKGAEIGYDIEIYNGSSKEQLIGTVDGTTTIDYSWDFTAIASDGALYIYRAQAGDGTTGAIDDISATQTAAASGGGIRRKPRLLAYIDGRNIQVSSYEEAVKLFQHFNKTEEKPTKKKLKLKVVPRSRIRIG